MTFRKVNKSQTLQLNEITNDLQRAGKKVYKFGFGESPFLPLPRVQEALQEAVQRKDYTPVAGIHELRVNVAEFHTVLDGVTTDVEQIVIGSGSKILLLNALFAFEDALVLVPAPSWVSYAPQATLAGHEVRRIPTSFEGRWRVEPEQLDASLSDPDFASKSKIVVLNYPGNPDGLTYSAEELQALTDVLRKHGAWVISDEIYGFLHHEGNHVSLRRYYPEGTIVTSGLSKWSGAGGWRLGVQIMPADAPAELKNALLGVASETYSCAPAPIQVAAIQAYVWDDVTSAYLNQQQRILRLLGQEVYGELAKTALRVHPPQGAFYLLLDFSAMRELLGSRGIETDIQLCEQLLSETGVALLPGSAFRMEPSALTARLAYVDFQGTGLLKEAKSTNSDADLLNTLKSACHQMFEGLQQLVAWLPQ